jgi:FkbM family methyltransferase
MPIVNLTVPDVKFKLKCRPTNSDRHTLSQVFFERDSDVSLQSPPQLIIDGGANVGYASVLFANKYPQAQIIAIEPDIINYQLACTNCANYPNVKVIQGAIWTSDTPVVIENPAAESWAFRVRQATSSSSRSVPGYTIATLLADSGYDTIDLLKLDIEGGEEYIFSTPNTDWISKVKVLAIEIHGDNAHRVVTKALENHQFTKSEQGEKLILRNQRFR